MDVIKGVITWLRARSASLAIGWSLAIVAATTGFVSYTHISALTAHLGQSWKTAHLYPLFIDGSIVIGSIYFMTRDGKRRWLGLLGIVPGVAESLFANWESISVSGNWLHVYEAHAWATVPAWAFAASSFLFERWLKDRGSLPVATSVLPEVVHEEPLPEAKPLPGIGDGRPHLVRQPPPADENDERLPLPENEDELRELILSTPGNALAKTHQITRYRHGELKRQFLNEGEQVA